MFHFSKKRHVLLIKHLFFFVPGHTAQTEYKYFNGHIFHYALGDHVSKLYGKICFM